MNSFLTKISDILEYKDSYKAIENNILKLMNKENLN